MQEYILGLDIGDARIGVATTSLIARLPRPLETIFNDEEITKRLQAIIDRESATKLVVGIPRNLDGEETAQSRKIRAQAAELEEVHKLPVIFVDESLSSKRANEYLQGLKKADIPQDSLAACFILEEYLGSINNV